jgi:hypothetical protein
MPVLRPATSDVRSIKPRRGHRFVREAVPADERGVDGQPKKDASGLCGIKRRDAAKRLRDAS